MIPYLLVVRIHYYFLSVNNSLWGGERLFEERVPVEDKGFLQLEGVRLASVSQGV